MKRSALFLGSFVLFLFMAFHVNASYRQEVLGESTQAADVTFPAVTSGTGMILPDSPFFFLDKIFQQIKLSIATTPEAKAKVRAQIIGERMAEVKAMLEKNNEKGITKALQNLTDESNIAAKDLEVQAKDGDNVEEASKTLNESFKQERDVLDSISQQTDGTLGLDFMNAREKVKVHKARVEGHLPEKLLQNELHDELQTDIEDKAFDAEHATGKIESHVRELQMHSSEAAKLSELKRLEYFKKSKATTDQDKRKQYELLIKNEKLKQEYLRKQQMILLERAKKASEAARELHDEVEMNATTNHDETLRKNTEEGEKLPSITP